MSLITSIQKYSVHDGNGIRTTFFFKGCPLSCTWCHNPETQKFQEELYYNEQECTHCQACLGVCPNNAISLNAGKVYLNHEQCQACGNCLDVCPSNLREIMGKEYEISYLVKEALKDEMFYEESNGGVTLSGGEVMSISIDYLESLVKALAKKGMSINIDTSGYTNFENFERILKYIDTFLYDVKVIDSDKHTKYMGKDNRLILENLKKLSQTKAKINIRIPLIKEVNADEKDIEMFINYLSENKINPVQINLLPYHKIGAHKYPKLGLEYLGDEFNPPSEEEMEKFKNMFEQAGFMQVKIGG